MAHPDLERLTAAYADAVWTKQPAQLAALYDDDVQVFDAWERWTYDGLAAWRSNIDAWLGSLGEERVQVCFEEVRTTIGEDTGGLTATVTYAAVEAGGAVLRSLQERLTWVLIRRGGDWRIAHQHTSFPIGAEQKAIMRRP